MNKTLPLVLALALAGCSFTPRDDDDRCCEPLRHLVQDADHGQRPFAVERRRRLVGEDDRWLVDQRTGDGDALLLATVGPSA